MNLTKQLSRGISVHHSKIMRAKVDFVSVITAIWFGNKNYNSLLIFMGSRLNSKYSCPRSEHESPYIISYNSYIQAWNHSLATQWGIKPKQSIQSKNKWPLHLPYLSVPPHLSFHLSQHSARWIKVSVCVFSPVFFPCCCCLCLLFAIYFWSLVAFSLHVIHCLWVCLLYCYALTEIIYSHT